ncbi:MAG: META domain-containing protein [Wenzhouxiangella sp.]
MHFLRAFSLLVVILGLVACAAEDSDAPTEVEREDSAASDRIQAEIYYLERISLPPDSVAVVELRSGSEPGARLLAAASRDLGDAQVPIPVELAVESSQFGEHGTAVFRAGIISPGGPMRVTEAQIVGPGPVDLGPLRLHSVPQLAFGAIYACDQQTVAFGPLGEAWYLIAEEGVFEMRAEIAASGARYVAVDGSETEFWSRGDEAMVTIDGEVLPNCELLRAPSLPLRALGHEPSWLILVDDETISLTLDFGARQIDFPFVAPEISADGFRYVTEADGSRLSLVLDRQPCSDTMVDLAYPFRARYSLDGEVGAGCAGAPVDVLTGPEWLIEQIGEHAVVPGTQPTIEFRVEDGEGRFAGLASCNRYMGGFQVTGEGLNLSPAASTLMACADEQQAVQERRLTGLLGEVYGFGIDGDGRLILRTGGGVIVAAR